ncbi:hypothetical protein DFH08DRAFT_1033455 [Mycena albidolilacea]|uniref:Uncharacterized protein n=1 Tax=Mycena albidolilacea TaxID=1033008 RepID=A0AAD7EGH0_9AGAR|nr:hypothetical protein DFH08DRAFT_1033455 [Mycena albidolilacea]
MLDENRNLISCLGELTQHVAVLEQSGRTPKPSRRGAPQRGRAIVRALSTRRPAPRLSSADSDDCVNPALCVVGALDGMSDINTEATTDSEFSDADDDFASTAGGDSDGPVVINEGMLTTKERKATRIFRQVCNVCGKDWPEVTEVRINPITKQQYSTPNFQFDVLNLENCALFRKVGERAQRVLSDKAVLKTLGDPIIWELDFTTECAKKSFRSFKKQWIKQATIEGREKAEEVERKDRRFQRRVTKSDQISKVADAVAEENDMDARFLRDSTHPEYLSNEVSGPDSDAETPETHESWKFRLATLAKLPNDPASLKNTHILEVLVPDWRAETRRHQKKGKGGNPKQYRVYAGRRSTRIPRYAPYNSGIKQDWLEDSKQNPDCALGLADCGNYDEPAGCEFKSIPLPA